GNHGGWRQRDGRRLGPLDFGRSISKLFRADVLAPWFAQHLKDAPSVDLPEALTFETGANEWRRWNQWPPASTRPTPMYLRADRRLSFEPPEDDGAAAEHVVSAHRSESADVRQEHFSRAGIGLSRGDTSRVSIVPISIARSDAGGQVSSHS